MAAKYGIIMKTRFSHIKYYGMRFGVALVSIYVALFLAEIALWRMEPKQYLREMYRGIHDVKDGRPILKPDHYYRYDDGSRHIEMRTNSYGYRGHEPSPNPKSRVLLVGDSFTFGALLDQKETIDTRMEAKEPGLEVDNLGVIAYDLPDQLYALRDWTLPANQAVYLFYYNDFETPLEKMVVDGYLVPRRRVDGTLLPEQEARMKIKHTEELNAQAHRFGLVSSLRLPRLRQVLSDSYHRATNHSFTTPSDLWPYEKDPTMLVPRSLGYTLEMRDLAVQRNMGFQIAIVPDAEEVRNKKHFPLVAEYITDLKAAGIPVIDLLPKLSIYDYWSYDVHFNPKGAQVAADEIYEALKASNVQVR